MMNLLDHFISNSAAYNRAVDKTCSLKNLLFWCVINPQPTEKLEKAAALMVDGWQRSKFLELIEESQK